MPDLDQLLDTLVADVAAGTRAPGAPKAIKQARQRRAKVAVAAAGAVTFIAVGGVLAVGTLGGSDKPSPIGEPTTPSSESPTVQESAEAPASLWEFGTELDEILVQGPGWAISKDPDYAGYDYAFNGPCAGDWGKSATGGADGGAPPPNTMVGLGYRGFPSEARASDAVAGFVANLESCTATAWRTHRIAQTGGVLASSAGAVAWIQQTGDTVSVLQVPTTDGPPPVGVQVEVAEWMVAYSTWQNQN